MLISHVEIHRHDSYTLSFIMMHDYNLSDDIEGSSF
jgi:hypothetical protein